MVVYKLLKDFPAYKAGELIYRLYDSSNYVFKNSDMFLSAEIVENSPEWFRYEELNTPAAGDEIFIISEFLETVNLEFDPRQHIQYILSGNYFESENDANKALEKIKKIYKSYGMVRTKSSSELRKTNED